MKTAVKLWHVYVLVALVSLGLTMWQASNYFDAGLLDGTVNFWRDAFRGNAAGRFLAFDTLGLGTGCFVLLWVEGRRVGIGPQWRIGYIALSLLIGVSTFVPLFFAHRQRVLDRGSRA